MTVEFDDRVYTDFIVKIENLIQRIDFVLSDDFPLVDGKNAVQRLRTKSEKLKSKIEIAPRLSPEVRIQLYANVSLWIASVSHWLGIIIRSNESKNPFELYDPFKLICQSFFTEDIFLIISSEWNFNPFTYPMTIEELPSFIVIGMPAIESENILVFPAAGHELGHSIWFKNDLSAFFSEQVGQYIQSAVNREQRRLEHIFPDYSGEDFDTNMFAIQLKDMFISDATNAAIRQMEEIFCDIIGILIFGKSYLYAFAYLVAPGGFESSVSHYPDNKDRASIIFEFANKYGYSVEGYSSLFSENHPEKIPYNNELKRLADEARNRGLIDVIRKAEEIFTKAGNSMPRNERMQELTQLFSRGIPSEKDTTLGELIGAGWEAFNLEAKTTDYKKRQAVVVKISDLVLKSAEGLEFERRVGS